MANLYKYKLLSYEIEDLLNKIKKRDDLWIDIGTEKIGSSFQYNKINQNIKEKIDVEVSKREKAWDIMNDTINNHINIYNNLDGEVKSCNLDDMTYKSLKGKNSTLQRRYGIKEYDVMLKKENIQVLYFGILAGTIGILILTLQYLNILNLTLSLSIYLVILIIYVAYLIKIMVLDRVNRNKIYFHKLDFNKPTENEIKKSKENDSIESEGEDSSCKEDKYGRGSKTYESQLQDNILDQIKETTELDSVKCLSHH